MALAEIFLFLAVTLLLSALTARGVSLLKSPLLLGYIIAGALIGPATLGLIKTEHFQSFDMINVVTLSLIGFGIGGELRIKKLRRFGNMIIWITLFEAGTAFIVVGCVSAFVLHMTGEPTNISIALGLIYGSFACATAPAGTVDVIKQYKASGDMTTTLYAVLGLDDILALLIFTITLPLALIIIGSKELTIGGSLLLALKEVTLSVLIGSAIGYVLYFIGKRTYDKLMIMYFSLGMILLNCAIAEFLELSPILLNMCAGIVLVNLSPIVLKKMNSLLSEWSPPIYVWFFVLIGSRFAPRIIVTYLPLVLCYVIASMIGKYSGAWLGGFVSKAPDKTRKYLGFTLLSQAGVAIGLSLAAAQYLENEGYTSQSVQITSVMTVTTFIIMLIGPVMVKYGLVKSGETRLND
jgi:Kef-type K+ transport system membrane component KefB